MGTMLSEPDQKSRRHNAARSKGQSIAPGGRLLNGIFLSLIVLLPFFSFSNSTSSQSISRVSPSPAAGPTETGTAWPSSIRSVNLNPLTSSQTVTINRSNFYSTGAGFLIKVPEAHASLVTPAPTGTLTPAAPSCTIAAGASTCNVTLTWTTTNPVGVSAITSNTPSANFTLFTGNNSTGSAPVFYPSRTFFLFNNALELDRSVATASCASGTSWNGSMCQAAAMTGTLTPAAPSCIIAAGASTCNVSLTWATINPAGVSAITSNTPSANFTLFTGNNSTGSAPVFYPSRTFFLFNNALELDRSVATASCASGTSWNGSVCQAAAMTGTLTPAAPSCIIAAGASTCNVSLTWATINPAGVSAITSNTPSANFAVFSPSNNGTGTAPVFYPSRTFFLFNNALELDRSVATASCASGTSWNGSMCQAAAMTGTLTPAAPSCIIAAGASTCNVSLTWATINPAGVSAITSNTPSANFAVFSPSNNGTGSAPVFYPSRTFFLYNAGFELDRSVATASCASGTTWTGSVCQAAAMTGTLTPAAPSCIIAAGASTCNVSLTWATINPAGVSAITSNTPSANFTLFTGNNSTGSAPVFYPSRTFFLFNNALELDRSVATASCASGTSWNGSVSGSCDDGNANAGGPFMYHRGGRQHLQCEPDVGDDQSGWCVCDHVEYPERELCRVLPEQ